MPDCTYCIYWTYDTGMWMLSDRLMSLIENIAHVNFT